MSENGELNLRGLYCNMCGTLLKSMYFLRRYMASFSLQNKQSTVLGILTCYSHQGVPISHHVTFFCGDLLNTVFLSLHFFLI
ncbi:hypothetical protein C0J52_15576 [Blattella germanica]|nr:hypothetical protein C0J52_15576 [Blattella germanica]